MDLYGAGMECRIDETLVHYAERGGGMPLVALHGAGVDHRGGSIRICRGRAARQPPAFPATTTW